MLTSISNSVTFPLKKEDKVLISSMKEKLFQLGGVDLAAPQVNVSKNIIAIYIPEEAALLRDNVVQYPMHIMINPSYKAINSVETTDDFEACYSVKNKAGKLSRYKTILLKYYDESGKFHIKKATGFYARVLQHEIDHLNGTLIIDRLTPSSIQGSIKEMMALIRAELSQKKREVFDKLMLKKLK